MRNKNKGLSLWKAKRQEGTLHENKQESIAQIEKVETVKTV